MALQLWEHLLLTAAPPASAAEHQGDIYGSFVRAYVDPVVVRVATGSQAKAGNTPRTHARSASKGRETTRTLPKPLPACPVPDLFQQVRAHNPAFATPVRCLTQSIGGALFLHRLHVERWCCLGILQVSSALSKLEGPALLPCAVRPVLHAVGVIAEAEVHRHEPKQAAELATACLSGITMLLARAFAALPFNEVRSAALDKSCQLG